MSRFRSTKYGNKPNIRRTNKGTTIVGTNQTSKPGGNSLNIQGSVSYTIPLRGGVIVSSIDFHLSRITSMMSQNGASLNTMNQMRRDLNNHIPLFTDWARRQIQEGNTPLGGLNSESYLDSTGGVRSCSACPGSVGTCAGACASLDIDTNIGGSNWNDPDQWKLVGTKMGEGITINIYFRIR